jgi:site-specific DNA-methyltransferase (adenine-specific)
VLDSRERYAMLRADATRMLHMMPDASVDLVLTDPPYGIGYRSTKGETVANDDGPFVWWLRDAARVLKPSGALVCFTRWDVQEAFRLAIGWAGLKVRSQVVWNKGGGGIGDCARQFTPEHELMWFACRQGFRFLAGRPSSVQSFKKPTNAVRTHPTEKPVDALRVFVRHCCPEGGVVLDPFAGSGSAGEAALLEGRRFLGFEIDATHATNARKRCAGVKAAPGVE